MREIGADLSGESSGEAFSFVPNTEQRNMIVDGAGMLGRDAGSIPAASTKLLRLWK